VWLPIIAGLGNIWCDCLYKGAHGRVRAMC
jgi:hypothetical protein